MKITIPGDPIPKARARVTRKGFAYDPQDKLKKQTIKYLEHTVEKFFADPGNRIEGHKLSIGEAFEVNWYFHMPIPKSFNQFKKNACKWGFIEHTSKPDRSNLEKFYEDCANGILWKDDSQITHGQIIKKYCNDDKPRTEIFMTPITQPHLDVKNIVSLFSPTEIDEILGDAQQIDMSLKENSPNGEIYINLSIFLSKLADQHHKKLSIISKKYPNHWKKLDSNSTFIHS